MQTIDQFIGNSCQRHSGRIALQHKTRGRWHDLSFKDLWAQVESLAFVLRENDLQICGHAALLGSSSPRWVIAYLSVLRAGAVAVPIDKELKAAELRHVLTDSDTTHIFVDTAQFDTLLEIIGDLPKLKKVILLDDDPRSSEEDYQAAEILDQLATAWRELTSTVEIPEEKKPQIIAINRLD